MTPQEAALGYLVRGWAPISPPESITPSPFNKSVSIPPGSPSKLLTNQNMAAALRPIDKSLAYRVEACRPGFYCRAAKYCALCGPMRADMLTRRFKAQLLSVAHAAHLTLTTRGCYELTRQRLNDLAVTFVRFRERRIFRQAVSGGVVNFQIDYGSSGWLPHIHAVLDQKGDLSNSWIKNSWHGLGGGWSVKLQAITPETEPRVLKYGARPQDLPRDFERLNQFYWATRGFQFIRPFGSLHPLHGHKPKLIAPPCGAVKIGWDSPDEQEENTEEV